MPEAVIVGAVRSPIGRAVKGSLKDLRADDMAAQMVRALLAEVPELDPTTIDDVHLGVGQPAGESGHNLARAVALLSGLESVPGVTVNRYCSSSLQTTRMAVHAIRASEGDVFLSVGVEAVSRYDRGRSDGMPDTKNPLLTGEGDLPDLYLPMGQTAENVAELRSVSREEQDEFALLSQQRAQAAIASGFWADEITPLQLPDGRLVEADDGPRAGVTLESLAGLKPVFREEGTVTAGNCCPLNDGAAALLLMSDVRAAELEITPLARVVATGVGALRPEHMGLGPVEASRRALARAGMTIDNVDLVEINEAFAAQVLPSADDLGVDIDKLNINGGAIAVGHPFGMTGARIATTLLHSLRAHDREIGLETMCVAGGQGMAMIVERLT